MRYIILAKGQHSGFNMPRQLAVINGERLLDRTIRLLRENGINDIYVTGNYTDINATVINPEGSTYDYNTDEGYWLDAFSGLLDEPTCFIWGDVYFSDKAIKLIVEGKKETFYCSYNNQDKNYIKQHDEPFAYKVFDTKRFSKHIEKLKMMYDNGQTTRNPIIWELYRSINGIDVNTHLLKKGYIAINDITCDIDSPLDILKLELKIGGKKMIRVEVLEYFTLNKSMWDKIKEIIRANVENNGLQELYLKDTFLCDVHIAKYLLNEEDKEGNPGKNPVNRPLVKVIEVIPEKAEEIADEQVETAEENILETAENNEVSEVVEQVITSTGETTEELSGESIPSLEEVGEEKEEQGEKLEVVIDKPADYEVINEEPKNKKNSKRKTK